METLMQTDFQFPGQHSQYVGKVRDVYRLDNDLLVMIATDRISAFDVVLPKGIPYKGQILNQIAAKMLNATADIVPNWLLATPDPNVSIGRACSPIKIEMVIRGYLSGHAARVYHSGERMLCGVSLPNGMIENDPFPNPIITPATKAAEGHDEDISKEAILNQGIISKSDYEQLELYTRLLFERGSALAQERGLILVDTKYEFGKTADGQIVLIDEIHTPDSSRYFYLDGYEEQQKRQLPQKQLSKEFVRQWLIGNGFQGLEGQSLPKMDDAYVHHVSDRYIELYESITGEHFVKSPLEGLENRILKNVKDYLKALE